MGDAPAVSGSLISSVLDSNTAVWCWTVPLQHVTAASQQSSTHASNPLQSLQSASCSLHTEHYTHSLMCIVAVQAPIGDPSELMSDQVPPKPPGTLSSLNPASQTPCYYDTTNTSDQVKPGLGFNTASAVGLKPVDPPVTRASYTDAPAGAMSPVAVTPGPEIQSPLPAAPAADQGNLGRSAAAAVAPPTSHLHKSKVLFFDECELCRSSPDVLYRERDQLMARAAALEAEQSAHAAAAAEAAAMKDEAARRAREIGERLRVEMPGKREQVVQKQQVGTVDRFAGVSAACNVACAPAAMLPNPLLLHNDDAVFSRHVF